MSQGEVEQNISAYKKGDEEAFDRIIKSHMYLVIQEVWRNIELPLTIDDMIGTGMLTLCEVSQTYSDNKTSFKSYARSLIYWKLIGESKFNCYLVRLPSAFEQKDFNELNRLYLENFSCSANEYLIYIDEQTEFFEIDKDSLIFRKELKENNICFNKCNIAELCFEYESLKFEIDNAFKSIAERQAEVLRLYFGFNGESCLTLEEIGGIFSLTKERIRQIKKKAIRRLRHFTRIRLLKILMSDYRVNDVYRKEYFKENNKFINEQDKEKKKYYFWYVFGQILEKHERKRIYSAKDYQELEKNIVDLLWQEGVPVSYSDIRFHLEEIFENITDSLLIYTLQKSNIVIKIKRDKYALKEWGYIPLT